MSADVDARLTSASTDAIRMRDIETARRRVLRQVEPLFTDREATAPHDRIDILLNAKRNRRVTLPLTRGGDLDPACEGRRAP